jgi:hypothetical protein
VLEAVKHNSAALQSSDDGFKTAIDYDLDIDDDLDDEIPF